MGRSPRCSKDGLNKGAWTAIENKILTDYVKIHGEGKWSNVAKTTGLKRCGKSCRLRWMNYLRPDIKRGNISDDEEELILRLHKLLGNRWSLIAGRLPGRTDNEIKNFWNTNLAKKAQELNYAKKPIISTATEAHPDISRTNANALQCTGVYASFEQQNVLDHDNNVPAGPILNGNLLKISTNNDTELSNRTQLSMSGEENSSDFMMDFNMDDFCKILDSDFTKLSDINLNHTCNVMEADCDINGCKSKVSPPEKLEENCSSGNDCVQADMNSEFLSLASSFLESAEEWPGDDLNIIHSN